MKRLLFTLPLALTALAGCEVIDALPPELVVVGCAVGPQQFPDLAEEITLACAGLAANAVVQVAVEQ